RELVGLDRYLDACGTAAEGEVRHMAAEAGYVRMLGILLSQSTFLTDIVCRHPEFVRWLWDTAPLDRARTRAEMMADILEADEEAGCDFDVCCKAMRCFRKREILRIAVREMDRHAPMESVTKDLSNLADAAIETAIRCAWHTIEARFGKPEDGPEGRPAAFTVLATFYAFKLEASFEVKDFFKSDSDFAVGLDKLDVHVGDSGGEPAITYIQGDLTDPAALQAIQEFMERLGDSPLVAKNEEGGATLNGRPIFAVLNQVMQSEYARAQIQATTGVAIEGDVVDFVYGGRVWQWPNSQEQLTAIYDYAMVNGVPLSPTRDAYDHLDVAETIFLDPTGAGLDATTIIVGIPGTKDQEITVASRDVMLAEIALLEASPAIARAQLTGSPYTRQASLDATTQGLQQSLLVAVVLCLLVAVVAMRSVRYGVVTIIPIGLVVAWLYAFMYLFGFGLNFVTATIAAVSVGVGIDYAIHMTQRYREELARSDDAYHALGRAAHGTGGALIASAATSILGFTIMAFAPMPMFSSYGILTAVMIFLAVTASLVVLPSLLLLVTPRAGLSPAPTRPAGT
ncbi:MAG: MMPL family transporter, partial [Chloroflexi bacterium]|nr:MMPL family transporter [Chloroflexota bacterium]